MPKDEWGRARAQRIGQEGRHRRAQEANGFGTSTPSIEDKDSRRSRTNIKFATRRKRRSAPAQAPSTPAAPAAPRKETSRTQARYRANRGTLAALDAELAAEIALIVAALRRDGMRALVMYEPSYAVSTGQPTARVEGVMGPGFEIRTKALLVELAQEVSLLVQAIQRHQLGAIRVVTQGPAVEIATREAGIYWVHRLPSEAPSPQQGTKRNSKGRKSRRRTRR